MMKELLPYDNDELEQHHEITLRMLDPVAGGYPAMFIGAALNAYSVLGIEPNTPVGELQDGPILDDLPTDNLDWFISIDYYGVEHWITVGRSHWNVAIDDEYPLVKYPQTRNTVLCDTLASQLCKFKPELGFKPAIGRGPKELAPDEVLFRGPLDFLWCGFHDDDYDEDDYDKVHKLIGYGNWAGILHEIYDEEKEGNLWESWVLECYNERIYLNRIVGGDDEPPSEPYKKYLVVPV